MSRPDLNGSTICTMIGVEGLKLKVRKLVAIGARPVLGIKPAMHEFYPSN